MEHTLTIRDIGEKIFELFEDRRTYLAHCDLVHRDFCPQKIIYAFMCFFFHIDQDEDPIEKESASMRFYDKCHKKVTKCNAGLHDGEELFFHKFIDYGTKSPRLGRGDREKDFNIANAIFSDSKKPHVYFDALLSELKNQEFEFYPFSLIMRSYLEAGKRRYCPVI